MNASDPPGGKYLKSVRSQVPHYDELQDAAVAAVPFAPGAVLDLGIGTGQSSSRLLRRFPEALITGLDSDPEMVFRAREQVSDVKLAGWKIRFRTDPGT